MSVPTNQPVVVGVDGSEQSLVAVRWAAEYAAHHHAPLELVYAIGVPADFVPGLSGPPLDYEGLREHGANVLAEAAEAATEAAAPAASIDVTTAVVGANPIPVLRDRSRRTRLVVVGSRGLGAFRRTLLGSVSTALARYAAGAVAIIPEHEAHGWQGPVVVGVDGSRHGARAVAIAFAEASARGTSLVAVHAWTEFARYESRPAMQTEAEALLSESIAGYREIYPEVAVKRVVVEDRPVRAILHAAESAQLIVVGSHGRGGFAGMTLGSVSQAVLHTAECPLIIVREPGDG
ncbi:universal stress protein [Nocardia cyriacigeorgica]|uniref:Putative universal stress protein n=2 Tax=Nocardia TaxID=1817 RepID=H6RA71_NOCCG|nr:universal stress protein [Nocardia cyriacigeorgica]BDT87319.1 universal stress protein [Nocardia cyriacigeorgica]CCF63679.1 Putative universal stress protein [Nocardia cyriacigeorgica GUH-2]